MAQGLEGVDIALRLGDADLASGCYDAASAAYRALGLYRSAIEVWRHRWELREQVTQELEFTDL